MIGVVGFLLSVFSIVAIFFFVAIEPSVFARAGVDFQLILFVIFGVMLLLSIMVSRVASFFSGCAFQMCLIAVHFPYVSLALEVYSVLIAGVLGLVVSQFVFCFSQPKHFVTRRFRLGYKYKPDEHLSGRSLVFGSGPIVF